MLKISSPQVLPTMKLDEQACVMARLLGLEDRDVRLREAAVRLPTPEKGAYLTVRKWPKADRPLMSRMCSMQT